MREWNKWKCGKPESQARIASPIRNHRVFSFSLGPPHIVNNLSVYPTPSPALAVYAHLDGVQSLSVHCHVALSLLLHTIDIIQE